jgi:YggT family protein
MLTDVLFTLLYALVALVFWSILLSALISILLMFDVLDRRNRFVWSIQDFLTRVTDPILRPLRRRIPTFNGVDLSPWVALVLLQILSRIVLPYFYAGIHYGTWQSLF